MVVHTPQTMIFKHSGATGIVLCPIVTHMQIFLHDGCQTGDMERECISSDLFNGILPTVIIGELPLTRNSSKSKGAGVTICTYMYII